MPNIKTINDRNSYVLPTVSELRASQQKGMCDEGMNQTDCTQLNAVQGHQADIRDFTEGPQVAKIIERNMMNSTDADVSLLDGDLKDSWPEITEL